MRVPHGRYEGVTILVLTQNLWGGAPLWAIRRRALARRIALLRPDIVGLQEVHAPDPGGAGSQAQELCGLVGGYHATFAPGRVTPSGRCEGVAILSRHAIADRAVVALSRDGGDLLDRCGPRVVLRATVDLPDGPVDAVVTHLSISRRARIRTVHELLGFVGLGRSRSPGLGAVLMGDLNAPPGEETIAALEGGGWLDAWKSANGPRRRGGTWPAIAPSRRIDYILVRPPAKWRVLGCRREPASGSDHRGVVASLGVIRG